MGRTAGSAPRTRGSERREVPHFLRQWRQERQLTQQQLADRTGTTHGTISRIENGVIELSDYTIVRFARALSIHPGDLYRSPHDSYWALCREMEKLSDERRATVMRLIYALDSDNTANS